MLTTLRASARRFLNVYSDIFFTDSPLIGALVLAVTFIDPNVGIAAIIALAAAYLFRVISFRSAGTLYPFYYYNAVLVGASIGALFRITPLTILFIASAGVFTYVLTVCLSHLFGRFLGVPILSLPFAIVSSLCYLLAIRSTNLFSNLHPLDHSLVLEAETLAPQIKGLLQSMAAVFFTSSPWAGLAILAALLYHSRILFFLAVVGYYIGAVIIGQLYGAYTSTFANLNYFNFILISMALGGVFLIPSAGSYVTAFIAVAVSAIVLGAVEVFWAGFGLPIFTLPFNIIVCLFLYYFTVTGAQFRTQTFLRTPEANLDFFLSYAARFIPRWHVVELPVSGEWFIPQSFDGEFTHKGAWQYAVDFVIRDREDREHKDAGALLTDYFCFGKPVLSPVAGRVIKVENDVDDNRVGDVNRDQNWGNYVLIYDDRGFYAKLCHFERGSIEVKEGDLVGARHRIGRCGNSGYSPTPHLHFQLQTTAELNSPTIPFTFANIVANGREFRFFSQPKKGETISAPPASVLRQRQFSPLLGETIAFKRIAGGREEQVLARVEMEADGRNFLTDGANRLYFRSGRDTFFFTDYIGSKKSILSEIFMALPSIPLGDGVFAWKDLLPVRSRMDPVSSGLLLFLQSFHHGFVAAESEVSHKNPRVLHSSSRCRIGSHILAGDQWEIMLDGGRFFSEMRHVGSGAIILRASS